MNDHELLEKYQQVVNDLLDATEPDDVQEVGGEPLDIARRQAMSLLQIPL